MSILQTENEALKLQIARLEEQIASERARSSRLEVAVRALASSERVPAEQATQDEDGGVESDCDEQDERQEELPKAIWDEQDDVYRCTNCAWEVIEGACQQCLKEFIYDSDEENPSCSTENQAMSLDRTLRQRGTTPLLKVSPGTQTEYQTLIERGATPLMCETFYLSYSDDDGIIAWADSDLYTTFSGPAMEPGEFWKIYLGRCIQLDAGDHDGSQFIEGIIEDAMLYSNYGARADNMNDDSNSENYYRGNKVEVMVWKTFRERPGVWATKPFRWDGETVDECEHDDFYEQELTKEDEALEGMDEVYTESVIDPGYENECSDEEDTAEEGMAMEEDKDQVNANDNDAANITEDQDEEDPGWSWEANVPDRVWEDLEESDEEMEDVDSDFDEVSD